MEKRSAMFMKNFGETKYLLHGTRNDFEMVPMDQDEGVPIRTNIFGIATTFEEVDGKKKYTAKMYKANANLRTREYRQVTIKGDGKQTKVFKIKTNGIEKELFSINTVVFDENYMNQDQGPAKRDFVLPVLNFMNQVLGIIK